MIIFLFGENSYNSLEKLNEIKARFKEKTDPSGINISTLEAADFNLEKFNNISSQGGFLVSKRLIVVKNLLAGKPSKDVSTQIKEMLDNFKTSENIFVFWEQGKPDARTELFKALTKEKKYVQEFSAPAGSQLNAWIKKYLSVKNAEIEPAAMNALIVAVGNDLWKLKNELDKLVAFSNGKIKTEHIEQVVTDKINENIFELIDAIGKNNKPLALKLLNRELKTSANEIYILSMIIRQFRIILQLKSLAEQNLNQTAIASQTGLHPFVVKKTLPLVAKFTIASLQKIYGQLVDLETKFKSTSLPHEPLLALFVSKI